jgi:RNA polymerase sigma factor (sigma-70 family)
MTDIELDPERAAQLLQRWQDHNDLDALDELLRVEVTVIAARLRAKGRNMMRPSVSASDLAQEAVFRLLRLDEAPEFSEPGQLRAYLWTAAWRLLLNRGQARGRSMVALSHAQSQDMAFALPGGGGVSQAERNEQAAALSVLLNLMRDEDREALESIYFRHETVEAYAERHGIARTAADMRLSRARRRLAEKMIDWADVVQ